MNGFQRKAGLIPAVVLTSLMGMSGCTGSTLQANRAESLPVGRILIRPIESLPLELRPDSMLGAQPALAMLSETVPLDLAFRRTVSVQQWYGAEHGFERRTPARRAKAKEGFRKRVFDIDIEKCPRLAAGP